MFKINIAIGDSERTVSVRTRGGEVKERFFSSLDAAARFVREQIHLTQFVVDATHFDPASKTVKRPDMRRRLTAAHTALSHAEWAQQKVQASRDGLSAGTNRLIEEDEWAAIRAQKRQPLDAI